MKKYKMVNSELRGDGCSTAIFVDVTYRLKWYHSKKKALEYFYALEGKELKVNNLRFTCLWASWYDPNCKEICLHIAIVPLSNGKPIIEYACCEKGVLSNEEP